jgi:hypothetical protein
MFVELSLQRRLTLREFRPMADELRLEHSLRTCGALRLDRDGSKPACHAKKWTLHDEPSVSIHGPSDFFVFTLASAFLHV